MVYNGGEELSWVVETAVEVVVGGGGRKTGNVEL